MSDLERFNESRKETKRSREKFDKAREYIKNYYKMYKRNTKNKIQACIKEMHKLRINIRDAYIYCGSQKN